MSMDSPTHCWPLINPVLLVLPWLVPALVWVLCRMSLPARPFLGPIAVMPVVLSGYLASLGAITTLRSFPPAASARSFLVKAAWTELSAPLVAGAVATLALLGVSASLHYRRHGTWPRRAAVLTVPFVLLSVAVGTQAVILGVALHCALPLPYDVLFPTVAAILTALAHGSLALFIGAVVATYRRPRPRPCA